MLAYTGFYKRKLNSKLDDYWQERVDTVLKSPDNKFITRVPNAGNIQQDVQIMHNGIKIHVGSYYGNGATILLNRNGGVHEPQEEKAFNDIMNYLPADATMLELGAFWAFYSMCFKAKIPDGKNYLIEPDPHALQSGKSNFKLNKFKGYFFNFSISDQVFSEKGTITVDEFLKSQQIDHLSVLHSDIQGFEVKMLQGATSSLMENKIDYIFISTHSNALHDECIHYLKTLQYIILCDANLDESYSWDGLIVAKSALIKQPERIDISKRW